ncbi:hypothetical protein [Shewanella sp. MM_2022_3]|uniref:hypothetical protein n=1 Tax=Shewanella sp. MM_2022_3 TaxID=2923280 RepID=UPI001F4C3A58|nr:hypothetical protein [Shewanella sp. MM_2022_3]MCH7422639.1 hypothetical protein [Shewanella sp. MM_2022_3]
MAFDYLTGSVSQYLDATAKATDTQLPTIAPNPSTTGWFDRVNEGLGSALGLYAQYEQIRAMKNANGVGQKELLETVQTPAPNSNYVYATPAEQMKQKMAQGLQIGTGTLGIVVGGLALLYWLSRKK